MNKNFNAVFILLALSSNAVYSATGIACANSDNTNCSYTTISTGGVNGSASVPVPRQIASAMAACMKEKVDIDKQFAKCNYDASLDNGRETALCNKFSDTSWTWGGSVGHTVIFLTEAIR